MRTYNFYVKLGKFERLIEIDADSENEALSIINESFPPSEGWKYILIG